MSTNFTIALSGRRLLVERAIFSLNPLAHRACWLLNSFAMKNPRARMQPLHSAVALLAMAVAFLASLSLAMPAHAAGSFSLRFHGNNLPGVDRVRIPLGPSTPADVGATDFTVEFWIKGVLAENTAPAVACGANTDWRHGNILVDRDRVTPGGKFGVSLASGRVVFGVSTLNGDLSLCSVSEVLDGEWHHVAVERRRADGLLAIFIDGKLDAQQEGPRGDVSFRSVSPGEFCGDECLTDPFLVIGGDKHGLGPSFSGGLDEVRISSILRYLGRFEPPATPFIADAATAALYHFDEGTGLTIVDSAKVATGASHGAIQFGGTPPGPEWSTDSPFVSEPPVLLTIGIEGNGTVTTVPAGLECKVSCFATFPRGTEVALLAAPAPSFAFVGWSGDPGCEDGNVVLNDSTTCNARFVPASDLALTMVSAPSDASPGEIVRVGFRIRNRGLTPAGTTVTRIYLTTDRAGSIGFQVGEMPAPELAPDEAVDGFVDVTIPSRMPAGRYFLIINANADSSVPETRTDNNIRRLAIAIGPDLVVTAIEAPLTIARGSTILVRDTTRNDGSVAVDPSTTRFFLAARPDAAGGQFLGERQVEALGPGRDSTGQTQITIPANTPTGLRFIIAVADGPRELDETAENNNASQAFAVVIH